MSNQASEQKRREFEAWGLPNARLQRYLTTYNVERNSYYNGHWDLAWESWQAATQKAMERAAKADDGFKHIAAAIHAEAKRLSSAPEKGVTDGRCIE